jgi:hypothetical protein
VAVASRGAALNAFAELIDDDQIEVGKILRRPYLPEGLEPSEDPVGMDPSTLIGGYGNEARYLLGAEDPATMLAIASAPADVLSGRPSISSDAVAAYAKTSLDLTMEGGTTSGVVYPLAVCELATNFRFRNVGGASAGAIAAALTASAELGRSSQVLASGGLSRHESKRTEAPSQADGALIRTGFAGVADIISWLTQSRPGDQEKDEYRLAQLFRAGNATAAIFRVAVAIMRGQGWPLPLLALFAFGLAPRLFTLALISGAVVLTGYMEWKFTSDPRTILEIIGLGAVGVLAFMTTVAGLVLGLQGINPIRAPQAGGEWHDYGPAAAAGPLHQRVRHAALHDHPTVDHRCSLDHRRSDLRHLSAGALRQWRSRRPRRKHHYHRRAAELDFDLRRPFPVAGLWPYSGHHAPAAPQLAGCHGRRSQTNR